MITITAKTNGLLTAKYPLLALLALYDGGVTSCLHFIDEPTEANRN